MEPLPVSDMTGVADTTTGVSTSADESADKSKWRFLQLYVSVVVRSCAEPAAAVSIIDGKSLTFPRTLQYFPGLSSMFAARI